MFTISSIPYSWFVIGLFKSYMAGATGGSGTAYLSVAPERSHFLVSSYPILIKIITIEICSSGISYTQYAGPILLKLEVFLYIFFCDTLKSSNISYGITSKVIFATDHSVIIKYIFKYHIQVHTNFPSICSNISSGAPYNLIKIRCLWYFFFVLWW
jgi:hypothetical protein